MSSTIASVRHFLFYTCRANSQTDRTLLAMYYNTWNWSTGVAAIPSVTEPPTKGSDNGNADAPTTAGGDNDIVDAPTTEGT